MKATHPFRLVPSPLGFGAIKIGRNQGVKYPQPYDLPDRVAVERLLRGILDLGCNVIDTAPAYGLSEQRLGDVLRGQREKVLLCTKVGEHFEGGRSRFDFSAQGIRRSLELSLRRLRTEMLDLVLIHSHGDDRQILEETDTVSVLLEARARGTVRSVGLSGKTVEGANLALKWADVIMVEYHPEETGHAPVMAEAARCGVGVFVKKGLSSGRLDPESSIRFALENASVTSLIVGGLNLDHFRANWQVAIEARKNRLTSRADQGVHSQLPSGLGTAPPDEKLDQ